MKRKLRIAAASVAGVLLLGVVSALVFIKPERIKNQALARLEAATGYSVTAGEASLKLGLGNVGIRVRDVTVASPDTSQRLFVNHVDVLVKPVPLLRKRVELSRLVLNRPAYTLETRPATSGKASEPGGALAVFAAESWAVEGGTFRQRAPWGELILQDLNLSGGFRWTPEAGGEGAVNGTVGTGWLRAVDGEWPLPATETSVRFHLSPGGDHLSLPQVDLRSGELNVRLTADYVSEDGTWLGVLEGGAAPVALETLKTWFPDSVRTQLEAWMVSGTLAVPSLRVEQTRDGSVATGVVALDRVFVLPPGLPVGVENASGRIRFSPEGTVFEDVKGTLGEDTFTASGRLTAGPPAEIRVKLATILSAGTLARLAPESAPVSIAEGLVTVDIETATSPGGREFPPVWGTVRIQNVAGTWRDLPLREGGAIVRFSGREAALADGRVRIGASDVALAGTVADTRDPDMRFTLRSSRLDLNELFPEETDASREPGSMVALPGSGSVTVGTLAFRRLRASDLKSTMTLGWDGLVFTGIRAAVYNGTVTGNLAVRPVDDGARWRYTSDLHLESVDALPLAVGFAPLAGIFEGDLSGDLDVNGIAGDDDPWRGLSMAGVLTLTDGALHNVPGLIETARVLNIKGVSRDRWPFRSLGLRVAVEQGRVLVQDVALAQQAMGWTLGGSIGFDGSLALKGTVRVDPKQITLPAHLGFLAPALVEGDGRIPVDFLVGGTTLRPDPTVDWDSLGKRAAERAKKQQGEKLEESLEKTIKDPDALNKLKKTLKIGGG